MLFFFVWLTGLLGTLLLSVGAVTYLVVSCINRRPGGVRVVVGLVCGYAAGARFVWSLVPREWALPFWTTLAASVNAEKYGHAVEHPAQGIVVWILFGAVVGAGVGGLIAYNASFLKERRNSKIGG